MGMVLMPDCSSCRPIWGLALRAGPFVASMPASSRNGAKAPVIFGNGRFGAVLLDDEHLAAALH